MSDPETPLSNELRWQTRTTVSGSAEALEAGHRLPMLVARVLAARGWKPGTALKTYLGETPETAPDPLLLLGVPQAAARLWHALDTQERVTICGDYDVDGITSTSLLVQWLKSLGFDVNHYLPHRFHDGYGLNAPVLERLAQEGSRVLVTVDNGITSLPEIALAQSLGMDVILTDHHLPGPELPRAHTIVNPQLMTDPGAFRPLAGVGVAYTLARGMAAVRPEAGGDLDALLDLVAIGTIGDMAPLDGENRRLVRLGLARIATSPRVGLAALARSVKTNLSDPSLTEHIGHRLIPRLNAAGRMAHPTLALELLLATDPDEAATLAEKLSQLNRQRRQLTEATEAAGLALLEGTLGPDDPAIVLAEEAWHHGITGIVASRLAERFGRPTLIFGKDGDGWRGSGRSVPGFDLHAALTALSDHLGRFGGHHAAVGLTVADGELEAFTKAFMAQVAAQRGPATLGPADWQVDAEVPLSELTFQSVEGLSCLQPTGANNPAPMLAARGLRVVRQAQRGPENQHLWVELADDSGRLEAIGFGMGRRYPLGEQVDAVFVPVAERWHGKPRLQLRLVAIE